MAMKGAGELTKFISGAYESFKKESMTTTSMISIGLAELFLSKLTIVAVILTVFFGIRSLFQYFRDKEYDLEQKMIELENKKLENSEMKLKFKQRIIEINENSRAEIINQRIENINQRGRVLTLSALKAMQKAENTSNIVAEFSEQFNILDDETEFLATQGITVPYSELLVEKTVEGIPNAKDVVEAKLVEINIGDDLNES